MKEIAVLSGKGGTGKTILTASFASLAFHPVIADCDVDAPNLHLLLDHRIIDRGKFSSRRVAVINGRLCNSCKRCIGACRFGALSVVGSKSIQKIAVDTDACEGCGVCVRICDARAIRLEEQESGEWFVSETRFGPLAHALLSPGGENSGKLVAFVKYKAKTIAKDRGSPLIIVDGPPGLSCPAISSAAGADLVVLVAEPTVSGRSDFSRIADLCSHMNSRAALVINRWDINPKITEAIIGEAENRGIELLGRVPFDEEIPRLIAGCKVPTEVENGSARNAIVEIWDNLLKTL